MMTKRDFFALSRFRGCTSNGFNDTLVGSAPAQVAIHGLDYLFISWSRILVQQCIGIHDHAGGAVAALEGTLIEKGLLDRMEPAIAANSNSHSK
jgi:hypothetical protein